MLPTLSDMIMVYFYLSYNIRFQIKPNVFLVFLFQFI